MRDLGDAAAPGWSRSTCPTARRVPVAEHLCGWTAGRRPATGPLWPTVADAVRALTGRTRDGEAWISVLEEFATEPRRAAGEALAARRGRAPAGAARRAARRLLRRPARPRLGRLVHVHRRACRAATWVLEYGDTPAEAARAALLRAEGMLGG